MFLVIATEDVLCSLSQGCKVPRAWILEIRRMGEQVLPTRDRSALRHLQGSGLLHSTQPVSVFTELLVFPHVLPFSYSFMYKRYRSLTMNWWWQFQACSAQIRQWGRIPGSLVHRTRRRTRRRPPAFLRHATGYRPDSFPCVLAYLFPLPESVGVISMWCQWGPLTVSVVSLLHTAAYVISDLYGIIWGNLFAWSSW